MAVWTGAGDVGALIADAVIEPQFAVTRGMGGVSIRSGCPVRKTPLSLVPPENNPFHATGGSASRKSQAGPFGLVCLTSALDMAHIAQQAPNLVNSAVTKALALTVQGAINGANEDVHCILYVTLAQSLPSLFIQIVHASRVGILPSGPLLSHLEQQPTRPVHHQGPPALLLVHLLQTGPRQRPVEPGMLPLGALASVGCSDPQPGPEKHHVRAQTGRRPSQIPEAAAQRHGGVCPQPQDQ